MKEFRTIEFFLYNYKNLDNMIKEVEKEYIDLISGSVATWLKSQNEEQNTLEDQVICMIDDNRICRYKKWQAFLKEMLAFLYDEYPIMHEFIMLKYIKQKEDTFIKNRLKLNDAEFKRVRKVIVYWLWTNALDEKIIC